MPSEDVVKSYLVDKVILIICTERISGIPDNISVHI